VLKLIGAGMGRTGTESLRSALLHLGYSRCHHMYEISDDHSLLGAWFHIAKTGQLPDWHQVFQEFDAQTDWPGAVFWRELSAAFPDAKVVLTVRDFEAWHESILNTIAPKLRDRHLVTDARVRARLEMANTLVNERLFDGQIENPAVAKPVFLQHIETVKETISPERLLVLDVAEGWEPLCQFLDVIQPDAPFPRKNTSSGFSVSEGRK